MAINRKNLARQAGFTLLELMVVIVILGVLASMVVPNLMGNKEKADTQKATSDIVALEGSLDMYKLDNHRYPTTEQGLQALVTKPEIAPIPNGYRADGYIRRLPQDPWGNDYLLVSPGEHGAVDVFLPVQTAKPIPPMILRTGLWIRKRNNEKSTRLYVAGNYSGAGDICQLRHDGGINNTLTQRCGYIWPAIKSPR
ncbi:Pectic enzymes secretion protein OutG [Enterobacter sp. DC3]|nr:Pectic enzymes secretion protein OutG [Enterobacter sp. DC3]EWG77529.1 Pectic enzymes secretion protein OutG [Enterobacter sp. DC4]